MSDLLSHTLPEFCQDDISQPDVRAIVPAVTAFDTGHICTPRADWGGRCWCQPRSYLRAALELSLRRTERRAGVIALSERRRVK